MRGVFMLISGLAIGLGTGLIVPDLDLGFSVGARPATPPGTVMQWVDRTHKGDRLDRPAGHDSAVTRVGRTPVRRANPQMLEGCEPAASTLSPSAQIAARCTA